MVDSGRGEKRNRWAWQKAQKKRTTRMALPKDMSFQVRLTLYLAIGSWLLAFGYKEQQLAISTWQLAKPEQVTGNRLAIIAEIAKIERQNQNPTWENSP